MKLKHISLTARNADRLAAFYRDAFQFEERRLPKRLSGEIVARGNGLPNSDIYVIWLSMTEVSDPFLEIMEYTETVDRPRPSVNEPGFGHLAFEVRDLNETVQKVLQLGGSLQGEITDFGTAEEPVLIVYVRDPEANIIELEQPPISQQQTLPSP